MKLWLTSVASLLSATAHAQRRLANDKNDKTGTSTLWTSTERCSCYEYLTNDFFRSSRYDFDQYFTNGHHGEGTNNNNLGYFHMAEFCCEFAAELVDPKCELTTDNRWVNSEGEPPHAPVEAMICDLFATPDVALRSELKQQARNACYCFYRDLGCGKEQLSEGGYCDYPHSEITLDDFRMANNSAHNMCNSCLEQDSSNRYLFPEHYEGQPHNHCLGYCLLKRGDPNDVYKPVVSDERCCFDDKGAGLLLHGFDENHIEEEIVFMPFGKYEEWTRDYFFQGITSESAVPMFLPFREYQVSIRYDGLSSAFMTVERYGTGEDGHPPAEFRTSEFPIQCEPEHWDSLSVHIFDESSDGGIIFKNVTMDGVELGDFGFAIQPGPSCSDVEIFPDIIGIHGHNYTCMTRPGGFGHLSGFDFQGLVELTGRFRDDDLGLELVIGCSKKKTQETTCCCDAHHHDHHIAAVTNVSAKW